MITIFATPRKFQGHFGLIQRNAIGSWIRLHPRPQVLLMGNDDGIVEACAELGVIHVPDIKCNEFGTPLINSMITQAEKLAENDLMLFITFDTILFNDIIAAAKIVSRKFNRFCIVGQRQHIDLREPIDFSNPNWESWVRRAAMPPTVYDVNAGDYFLYPKGFWRIFPPFAMGRSVHDNWMFYRTLALGGALVDATLAVTTIHQEHDYSHHPQGYKGVCQGIEAQHNRELAGSGIEHCSILDANYILTQTGVKKGWPSIRKMKLKIKNTTYDWLVYRTGPFRHKIGLRRANIPLLKQWLTHLIK